MTGEARAPQARAGRIIPAAIGMASGVGGVVLQLYTNEARDLIESDNARAVLRYGIIVVIMVGACALTWWAAERYSRSRRTPAVVGRELAIRAEDFQNDLPIDQALIGRKIHYLERRTASPYLVILLPGLGLDADDFRTFMSGSPYHTAAITLFGFNVVEANDSYYKPIGFQAQAELMSGVINGLRRENPEKKIILVGFSVGADMLLRLGELWHDQPDHKVAVDGALLLDPNVNSSTLDISRAVAKLDVSNPVEGLKSLVLDATTREGFQNICEYVYKITRKNLEQVRRHANDLVAYWDSTSSTPFLQRVANLKGITGKVRVIFSAHYEQQFNELVNSAKSSGLDRTNFDAVEKGHFQLLQDDLLTEELDRLAPPQPGWTATRRPFRR